MRDKDAVQAALVICEVAAYYKSKGKNLYQGLQEVFDKYGYYKESLESLTLKGKEGSEKIQVILKHFRENPPRVLVGKWLTVMEDYKTNHRTIFHSNMKEEITLPQSNVLKFFKGDGSWFALRPSGTEPKLKVYFSVKGLSLEDSHLKLTDLQSEVMRIVNELVM